MPQQFRTIQRTIHAEHYLGDKTALKLFCGDAVYFDDDGEPVLKDDSGDRVDIENTDWVIRTLNGFIRERDAEFGVDYVTARADDTQAVVFKMTTVEGREMTATVEGWVDGKDAVRALMHIGSPKVVLEFCKEQITAGDMSMLTLMNELAEKANPGE